MTRLKHILDLSTLQDPTKYPFTDLDALYPLILGTRSDDKLSARAMAICIQYPKYFGVISPENLAKVLRIEKDDMFPILYELGSLLDTGENYIRLFHASFGDFLYDKSRSHDLCCVEGNIVADIACCVLEEKSQREVPSYHTTYRLMVDATPCEDLRDVLTNAGPELIFGRYSASRRPQGSYYLIPLLRQIKTHISSIVFKSFVTYFDDNFRRLLFDGSGTIHAFKYPEEWSSFSDEITQATNSVSIPANDDADLDIISDDESAIETDLLTTGRIITHLAPLIRSSAWDGVREQVKTSLISCPSALRGLCDEADFVRSYLPKTSSSTILRKWSPESDAIFCLEQMASANIEDDVRVTFANLLSHSLLFTAPSSDLTNSIESILAQPMICQKLPPDCMEGINQYMEREAAVRTNSPLIPPLPQDEPDSEKKTPPIVQVSTGFSGPTFDMRSPPQSSSEKNQPDSQPRSIHLHVEARALSAPPDGEATVQNTPSHVSHEAISAPQSIKKGKRRRSPDKQPEDVPNKSRRPTRSCRNPKHTTASETSITPANSESKRKLVDESVATVNKKRKWKGYAVIDETTGKEVFDVDGL